ncbi:MBL fold metallo-hydrolase [Candidatus Bathyarchaeota archaeon]|nr:MBL fold metallo-hydrolase [Candidatus Bathyarchaeota archaeon]
MAQKSKVKDIHRLLTFSLGKNEVAFMYLEYSGVIIKTSNCTIIIDPADLLKDDEINAIQKVDLLLFTHSHGDHYSAPEALAIFKATGAPIIAEPLVAQDLTGQLPSDKLISAVPGKTYIFGDIKVNTIIGIHQCPINLYQIQTEDICIFHAGDSGYVPVKEYPVDLAFLPTGIERPFIPSASPENAFKLALELRPRVIVTFHGSVSHSKELENKIKETMPKTTVILPELYMVKTITLNL